MERMIGSTIGPYEIVSLIGAGGMGQVYRARDLRLDRHVAIKIISAEAIGNPDRQRRFMQEARSASALNHPNILSVYDIGTENEMQYIVSEFVEGETLRKILFRGPVTLRKFLDIATQIAFGLSAAHEAGIVHRDLKPENVMMTPDGRLKLLDFGLSKMAVPKTGGESDVTKSAFYSDPRIIMGTAAYMSPEQARGEEVDFRSDQFSFGLILYEMATGRVAFDRESAVQILSAIITDEPEPIASLNPKLPASLRWQIERCLSKERRDRYGATIDLYHQLRDFRTHLSETSGIVTGPRVTKVSSRMLQRRLIQIAAVAMIFVLGFIAAWLFAPQNGPDPASYRFTPVQTSGADASWSPDGKSIAYAADVNGVSQIFTRSLERLVPVQLTNTKTNCMQPFWSPDGTRIYYTGWREQRNSLSDLWIVSVAGGSPVLVQKGVVASSISPDGKTLLSLRNSEKDQFLVLSKSSPFNSKPEPFRNPNFDQKKIISGKLQFSHDGKKVAAIFEVYDSGLEFWLIDFHSGQAKQIFKSKSDYIDSISWMPDNRHAVASGSLFHPERTQQVHLWFLDLNRESATSLTSGINWEVSPAVDPQGKRILFSVTDLQHDIVQIPLDGGPMRNLIATKQVEMAPSWSPNGKYLIYESRKTGKSVIWMHNAEEGWERPVVTTDDFHDNATYFFSRPAFSPDGQRIAYHRDTKAGESSIWISPLAGGTPLQVYKEARRQFCPSWSPDGNWIFYVYLKGTYGIAKVRVDGSAPPIDLVGVDMYYPPYPSPDGKLVLYQTSKGLHTMSSDGKNQQLISTGLWHSSGWSKDGTKLFGVKQSNERHLLVVEVTLADHSERIISDLGPAPLIVSNTPMIGFSLASDGKSFVTSRFTSSSELWMLENFQR
jgi:Tol biopolymer transport system component